MHLWSINAKWWLLSRNTLATLSCVHRWHHHLVQWPGWAPKICQPGHACPSVLTLAPECQECQFFVTELDFLGHHISVCGIKSQSSTCDKTMKWPKPHSATDVWRFLGLVRYIVVFLLKLVDHTIVQTPLMSKDSHKQFWAWTAKHDFAFELIKALVCSLEWLTVIDHVNPGDKKIYLTCDANDWRTVATLSFGSTWETAWLVDFNAVQLLLAGKSYPIHEKELLMIVCALKKWRSDLMGSSVYVYTDHKTLINFDVQCNVSHRQLWWQELLSQYEIHISYIHGEDNMLTDALSWLPANDKVVVESQCVWSSGVSATFSISTDNSVLCTIMNGYSSDPFSQKLGKTNVPGVELVNGLWYIGTWLLILRVGDMWEQLYHLVHDTLGHFGSDKSYATLKDNYYRSNMWCDLEKAYIQSCVDCQQNKSPTTRPPGPLHPLPVLDEQGHSIVMDFTGPLKEDLEFNWILSVWGPISG